MSVDIDALAYEAKSRNECRVGAALEGLEERDRERLDGYLRSHSYPLAAALRLLQKVGVGGVGEKALKRHRTGGCTCD